MATKIGTDNSEVIDGTILGDSLDGRGGNDILTGNAGVDTLIGGTGADSVFGGLGRDFLLVGDGHTAAGEIYDGGGGDNTDSIVVSQSLARVVGAFDVDFSQSTIIGIEVVELNSSIDLTARFAAASFGGSGLADTVAFVGGSGQQTVVIDMKADRAIDLSRASFVNWGLADDVVINGDSDAEVITGGSQRDIISAGGGADIVSGGAGDDIIIGDNSSSGDVYSGGSGVDQLAVFGQVADLRAATLSGFEVFIFEGPGDNRQATFNSQQFGSGLSSSATMNAQGGTTNTVIVNVAESVFNAGNLSFFGFDADDRMIFEGGSGANSITGSKISDVMRGGLGNDVLIGGAGNDTLDGGQGNDIMFGGSGDDLYIVDSIGDTAAEILIGNDPGGIDKVISSVSHTLTGFIENLDLSGSAAIAGTGNALNNYLAGNAAANVLSGLGGNDKLAGRGGADVLSGGVGADQFIYAALTDSLAGAGRDRITDFGAGDVIRVSAIDANALVGGDQAFVEDANGILQVGEFRFREANGSTFIEFEANGTAGIDMQILVTGATGLAADDLIL